MKTCHPWHRDAWVRLRDASARERLGHALLLTGRPGVGKATFADCLAMALLCEARPPQPDACGTCRSCVLFEAGNHPDLRRLTLQDDSSAIAIDQVREIMDFFALTTHYGKAKLALIDPAERLTRSAANALLKLLEEPQGAGMLVLVTAFPESLPATIRSRCQRLRLDTFDPDVAWTWLRAQVPDMPEEALQLAWRMGGRAPLTTAKVLASDAVARATEVRREMQAVAQGRVHAVQAAERTHDIPAERLADLMLVAAHDLVLRMIGAIAQDAGAPMALTPADAGGRLPRHLAGFAATALEVKALAAPTANFRQADLGDLLWQAWMRATRPSRQART